MNNIYHIPLIIDADMNFIYQQYNPDHMDIILEDKIRESIIYLLSWLNKYVLIKPDAGYFIRDRLKNNFSLDLESNLYLFNSYQHWKLQLRGLSKPLSIINNKHLQPEYIGHTDLGIDWNMEYTIFTYPTVIINKIMDQPPQRDETGKIVFYCKIGEEMVPLDVVSDKQDVTCMFPGACGSPKPQVNPINNSK